MANTELKTAILEIIENQLTANDPPETRQTLSRLTAAGYSRQEAVEMIATVVVTEVWDVMRNHAPFDRKRFAASLKKLK